MVHVHHHSAVSRKLAIATTANLAVVVAELAAGWWTGSLSLIGDALHNLTDAGALIIALAAVRIGRRSPTVRKSFGYQRAGILAAFINASMLVAFTLFVFREAFVRLFHPRPVEAGSMMIVASVALLVNGATAWALHGHSRNDVNIRGAFVHMVGDALSSAGIIVAAILIRTTGAPQWDAAVTIVIGLMILGSSYGVLRESVNLLLEGTPHGIDPVVITNAIAGIAGVEGVHHLHVWAIGPSSPALSCHVMVGDIPLRETAGLLEEINASLEREHGIVHTTIQFELGHCAPDDPFCVPGRH
jgi:cobalt-zinc-cadmium efflux system protein